MRSIPLLPLPFLATVCALAALSGCGGRSIALKAHGVAPLNVNESNESLPVNVRFYALASDGRFRTATAEALWTDDKAALGTDRLGEPVVKTIFPGAASDAPVSVELGKVDAAAKFIGVLALFRAADATGSRTLLLPIEQADGARLEFTGFTVALATK